MITAILFALVCLCLILWIGVGVVCCAVAEDLANREYQTAIIGVAFMLGLLAFEALCIGVIYEMRYGSLR